MIKNAGHIILTMKAIESNWKHYNIDSCFEGVKENIHIPKNYDYSYYGFCTKDSEYTVDFTKLVDQHSGITIVNGNGSIGVIINGHPSYFSRVSKVFPEYSVLNGSEKSCIYKSNEEISKYFQTEFTLEYYLEEDEHFQELMLYNMVQHQDIEKIRQIRNDLFDLMLNNKYSVLVDHNKLDNVYDLQNTEIKESVLDTIEEHFKDFKLNYQKAKTDNNLYFNDIYKEQ